MYIYIYGVQYGDFLYICRGEQNNYYSQANDISSHGVTFFCMMRISEIYPLSKFPVFNIVFSSALSEGDIS